MIMSRGKVTYLVFPYLMLLFLGLFYTEYSLAQSAGKPQWSESAKSLTIFQPGDAVRIRVWELYQEENKNLNLSGDYAINPDGFIVMPIIGEVKVEGLTVYELMQTLDTKFREYLKNPFIEVRPLIRITLQGAFNRPGAYLADPSSSLWNVVALAGGPSGDCDLKRMWVERGGEVVIKSVLHSFEKGYSLEEIGIESGDQILAPARSGIGINFFIGITNLFASIVLLYLRLKSGHW